MLARFPLELGRGGKGGEQNIWYGTEDGDTGPPMVIDGRMFWGFRNGQRLSVLIGCSGGVCHGAAFWA